MVMKPVDFIFGIDPSSSKLAVTITDAESGQLDMQTVRLSKTNRPRACWAADEWITELLGKYAGGNLHVFLEEPVYVKGRGGLQALKPMCLIDGAVLASVERAGASFNWVNNSTWKATIVGDGHASKTKIGTWLAAYWKPAYDMASEDQDLFDSACINLWGKRIVDLARRRVARKQVHPRRVAG